MEQQTSQELINDIMREIYTFQSFSVYTEGEWNILETNIKNLLEEYFKHEI
jgi:hypothetical protein